jgi:hypothetical protein
MSRKIKIILEQNTKVIVYQYIKRNKISFATWYHEVQRYWFLNVEEFGEDVKNWLTEQRYDISPRGNTLNLETKAVIVEMGTLGLLISRWSATKPYGYCAITYHKYQRKAAIALWILVHDDSLSEEDRLKLRMSLKQWDVDVLEKHNLEERFLISEFQKDLIDE